ncbi:MAG: circularly permuted type 2 ATP-grasp protein, partial [Acidimicrobiales bacterium]
RLDTLVLKPVDGSGGHGLLIGPHASDEQLARAAVKVRESPRSWIAQEVVTLSVAPTRVLAGDGEGRPDATRLAPRHLYLRPFVINDGQRIWVLHGGLTRVALNKGSLVVNSSQGGGSKDTWVLAAAGDRQASRPPLAGAASVVGGPVPLVPDSGPVPGPAMPSQSQQ